MPQSLFQKRLLCKYCDIFPKSSFIAHLCMAAPERKEAWRKLDPVFYNTLKILSKHVQR